jgi:hypothetical protein
MVGALIGGIKGYEFIPTEYFKDLDEYEMLYKVGYDFSQIF